MPRHPTITLAALALLALWAPAAHASGKDVIRDCTDDEVLTKTYTQQEYKQALGQLASDADQYGNCRSVIKRAQLAALRDAHSHDTSSDGAGGHGSGGVTAGGGGHGGGAPGSSSGRTGGFGSAPAGDQLRAATPGERKALARNRSSAGSPVDLRGAAVAPGVSSDGRVPSPLVVLLALVLAGALALAAIRIRARVLAHRA